LRTRARAVLDRLVFDTVQHELRRAVQEQGGAFDLEGALTALARLDVADLAPDRVGRLLDEMAERITPRLSRLHHPLDRVGAINTLLFGEQHFALVYRSQAEVRHFCLPLVLESRAGAPAVLVAIYLLLADRIDLPLRVVWLPSHECLRLESGGQEIYVEPARSGRILSRRELIQTCLRDYHHNDSYVREGSRRDVVIRAVRGMMLLSARTRDWARSEKLGRVLGILQGSERGGERPKPGA
jgi:regulator of sirC expression with transglutaminase-like and TPR domain